MDERVENAKTDERVNFNFLINNKISAFSAFPKQNVKKIVIFCHGLGSDRTRATRFYDKLNNNNVGIIAFDFPSHGSDTTDYSLFTLDICIEYLNEVIEYVKSNYSADIYLFGSSFGGFVILNRLIKRSDDIKNTFLMCPAINLGKLIEDGFNISLKCYDNNIYMSLYNDIKIYKDTYLQIKQGDVNIYNYKFKNVSIIQGKMDDTVHYNDILEFCKKNNLDLITVNEGKHGLHGYSNLVVESLLKVISME